MADAIPFGQPILICDYQKRGIEISGTGSDGPLNALQKRQKKPSTTQRKRIDWKTTPRSVSDDPGAIGALREKLKKCEEFQERSKLLNKIIRKKTTDEQKIADLIAAGFKEATARAALVPDSLAVSESRHMPLQTTTAIWRGSKSGS